MKIVPGESSLAANDDALLKLQDSINTWAEQVTQTKSELAECLSDPPTLSRPAFRLIEMPQPVARPVQEDSAHEPGRQALHDLVEANKRLMRGIEDLEGRLSNAEGRAAETERASLRLGSELEFAREQLHLRNASWHDAADRQAEFEMRAEESEQALARSDIEIADVHQQLRSKDWRLLKTRNELDALREEHARTVSDSDSLRSKLDVVRSELEGRRISEHEALAALDESRVAARELKGRIAEIEETARQLNDDIDLLQGAIDASGEELKASRHEIVQLNTEAEHRKGALIELEGLVAAMQKREAAHKDLVTRTDQRAEDLEAQFAVQARAYSALQAEMASARTVPEAHANEAQATREAHTLLLSRYDDLAESHMTLRDEVKSLQQRVVEREFALKKSQSDLANAQDRAQAIVEDNSALEAPEQDSFGQRILEQALREELESVRERLERDALDQSTLRRALKSELDALRQVAIEKDFVIHHAQEESASLTRREAETEETLAEVRSLSARLEAESSEDAESRQVLAGELQELVARSREKDEAIRELRSELSILQERAKRLEDAAPRG